MKHKIKLPVLALELIIATLLFGTLMTIVNSFSGYREFKKELENLYGDITIQLAKTGASYIHVDSIPYWVKHEPDEEWEETNKKLDTLTNTSDLAYIYVSVISPDYKSRTYVFDTVNKLSLEAGSKVIPFGTVSSLENKDEEYIKNLKLVIEEGKNYTSFTYKNEGGHVTTAIPLFGTDGKVTAIMSIVKPMNEIKEYRKNFLRSIIISATILTLLFIALYASLLYLGIIRPIISITYETSHFAEHHGELTGILTKIHNRDEIGKLAKSVEKMSRDMNKYIEDLTHATAEKERLGAELNVATQIQAEMLPRVFPPYENHPEIELYASMEPAKEVGGDFYDFYMVDDDHFAMVVGDVSGKGVPAALFMVITKTLLKDACAHSINPAEVFERVNTILCEGNDSGLFVTCWMGILTLSTGELNFANAGHTAPIIKANGEIKYLSTKPNLMLAAMDGISYTNNTLTMNKGDRLFIYTDGITEATNEYDELYGENRLLKILSSVQDKGKSPRDILDIVRNDLSDFVLDAPQFDDITMLSMVYKEEASMELTIQADDKELERVLDFIHKQLPADCETDLLYKIHLAAEEIFVNIAHYAYKDKLPEGQTGTAWITCTMENDTLTMIFKDTGIPFNPLAKADPDITLSAKDRSIGGLGIFLTKKYMDSIDYKYENGENILTMKKTIFRCH